MKGIVNSLVSCLLVILILPILTAYTTNTTLARENEGQDQSLVHMEDEKVSKLIGDVNGDGTRDSIDLALMRAILLGKRNEFPISNGIWASDLNGDGSFNSLDVAFMKKFLIGKIDEFPAESIVTPSPNNTIEPTPIPTDDQTNEKPEVPKDFHYVTKTEASVTLAWDRTDENVSYDIYVDDSYFATTSETSFTVDGLNKNSSYEFYVIAKDKSGDRSEPTEHIVVTTMDNLKTNKFVKVTGGKSHTVALKEDGTVWTCGSNENYCLGNDIEENSAVPVRVDKLTDIVDISAGEYYTLALRRDGTVWAWGDNRYSQCGVIFNYENNYNNYRVLPIKISGINGVEQVFAGSRYSYALKDGELWGWGDGNEKPKKLEKISNIEKIYNDEFKRIIALKKDGTVWYSQDNYSYQIIGFDNAQKVVLSDSTSIALKNNGSVWYKKTSYDSESYLLTYFEDVVDIELYSQDFYFLLKDGTVYKWNQYSLDEYMINYEESEIPTQIKGLADIISMCSFWSGMFFIRNDGMILSMGYIEDGNLGNGLLEQNYPIRTDEEYNFNNEFDNIDKRIILGNSFCGDYELLDDGTVIQLSNYTRDKFSVSNLSNVVKLYRSYDYILALKNDGTVWAWGRNLYGQLGDGTTTTRYEPVQVKNISGIVDIVVGGYNQIQNEYAIAIKNDGTLWAWGRNDNGCLGVGNAKDQHIPVKLVDENGVELTEVVSVKVGTYHRVALKSDGTVWAWGKNDYGQLGDGTNTQSFVPKKVKNLSGVISIGVGYYHSLVLKNDGTVWSWGNNEKGQLGNNEDMNSDTPVRIFGLNNVIAIGAETIVSIFMDSEYRLWKCGSTSYDTPVRVTMENDANLRFIAINNSFLESFDEDITEYNVTLPAGTTEVPKVKVRTYNPNATYSIVQPETIDGTAIIEVTAWDGETTKTYKVNFNHN